MRGLVTAALLMLMVAAPAAWSQTQDDYRAWILAMQDNPRGPFSRIRWFCNDGTVLPPKAYACREHGGGVQHGQWSAETVKLRERGYLVANLLAAVDTEAFLQSADVEDQYAQLLIERFLMAVEQGWIFRQAIVYRGAIQEEDERAGGRALLTAMAADSEWLGPRFAALRAGVKLLPHGDDNASIGRIRQWSADLSEGDPGFMPLRVRIHGTPSAADAEAVRRYSRSVQAGALKARYDALADEIDRVYQAQPLDQILSDWVSSNRLPTLSRDQLGAALNAWPEASAIDRLTITGGVLAALRDALEQIDTPSHRVEILDVSLRIEAEHFKAGTRVREQLDSFDRSQVLAVTAAAADAAYGTGLLNARLHNELLRTFTTLDVQQLPLSDYRAGLDYLALANGWAVQNLRRYFYPSMMTLAEIEPEAKLFIQDQLRGSPLLLYSQALDHLLRDAGQLAGIKHSVFGTVHGVGFNALNPGTASGVLHTQLPESLTDYRSDGIYLLPETVSDLPPIAGIITRGAGNPLSHVQLLARNLGIPNVSVSPDMAQLLSAHDGERVLMQVSPAGQVRIDQMGDRAAPTAQVQVVIRPDLDKLDLDVHVPLPLAQLRAADSGRTVGPKAAKLAELRKHYPEAVSRGVAIPFGMFRDVVLEQAHRSGTTLWEWMVAQYRHLDTLQPGSEQRKEATEAFRAELYTAILNTPLPDEFREALRQALMTEMGSLDVGVFVRSDTNVEDLAGFTGAGLNLTLPNVIGIDAVLEAIPRVWASPFTERAFAWRQAHMEAPEHVYTSVLLLESVGSDKSGVLVTADIDTGARDVLSVAVNEGLGGAVDGQAAESLRISADGETVTVLATATAPWRRVPDPAGGILKLPASGADTVMTPLEIKRLAAFAQELPQRFGPIEDDEGRPAPADVEFGFLDGQLRLFQIRPFLDNQMVQGSSALRDMDKGLDAGATTQVPLSGRPAR